jgi:hypothetical protein
MHFRSTEMKSSVKIGKEWEEGGGATESAPIV